MLNNELMTIHSCFHFRILTQKIWQLLVIFLRLRKKNRPLLLKIQDKIIVESVFSDLGRRKENGGLIYSNHIAIINI